MINLAPTRCDDWKYTLRYGVNREKTPFSFTVYVVIVLIDGVDEFINTYLLILDA